MCEPCTANGDLKTGRKGLVRFTVRVHGKSAHAGNAHKEGINAIEELAHEILAIQKLTDYEAGTTVNVGVCSGGTKPNVVPAEAEIEIDCRVKTAAEGEQDPQGDHGDQDDCSGNNKGSHRAGQQDADGGDGGEHGAL